MINGAHAILYSREPDKGDELGRADAQRTR